MIPKKIPQVPQQRANGNPNQKPAQLYVSNLSGNIKDQELTQLFQDSGLNNVWTVRHLMPGPNGIFFSIILLAGYKNGFP